MTNSLTPSSSSSIHKLDVRHHDSVRSQKNIAKFAMFLSIISLLALASCSFILASVGVVGAIIGGTLGVFFGITFIVAAIKYCQKPRAQISRASSTSSIDISLSSKDIIKLKKNIEKEADTKYKYKMMYKNIQAMKEGVTVLNAALFKKEEELKSLKNFFYKTKDDIFLLQEEVRDKEAKVTSKLGDAQSLMATIEDKKNLYKESVAEKKQYKLKHSFSYRIKPKFKQKVKNLKLINEELSRLELPEKECKEELTIAQNTLEETKEKLKALNIQSEALSSDNSKLQQLVDEEHARYLSLIECINKEEENLQKVEQDLEVIKEAQLILKGQRKLPDDYDVIVLQTDNIIPIDAREVLVGPLLDQESLNFSYTPSLTESDRLSQGDGVRNNESINKVDLIFMFYNPKIPNKSFNPNSTNNLKLTKELTYILKTKGCSFVKKLFSFFSNPIKEIITDFGIFSIKKSSSNFFGVIEKLNDLISSHSSLGLLHALMTNPSIKEELLPMIRILHKKDQELPGLMLYLNYIFNALISSLFINVDWSEQEFQEFCQLIDVDDAYCTACIKNGVLFSLILEKITTNTDCPNLLESVKETDNALIKLFNTIIPICQKKSIHDVVPSGVMTGLLSKNLSMKEFFEEAPHLLAWLKINLVEKISGPKRKIISIINHCKGLRAIGDSLLSILFVYQLYPLADVEVFFQAIKWPKKKCMKAIQEKKVLSLIFSLI
ncbi:hypothetical protein CLAVI_000430 [Candidatus Clavichlamydia salmonicola]|uniref:hypothetical protein n=1 Tax=Candidatus Clavichlamydia salmonicola TaxID=469812 RepID=UPI0018914F1F|nr:hypothetical protein [Candidatus Clavichlamydia salmonicola]MBF5050811.1 hypothetical protein [Candidatus Clavichlamydia salmonicola]